MLCLGYAPKSWGLGARGMNDTSPPPLLLLRSNASLRPSASGIRGGPGASCQGVDDEPNPGTNYSSSNRQVVAKAPLPPRYTPILNLAHTAPDCECCDAPSRTTDKAWKDSIAVIGTECLPPPSHRPLR